MSQYDHIQQVVVVPQSEMKSGKKALKLAIFNEDGSPFGTSINEAHVSIPELDISPFEELVKVLTDRIDALETRVEELETS